MTLYIGVCGKMGVGKSTLSKSIKMQLQERDFKCDITPLAETLKQIEYCASTNDWKSITDFYTKLGHAELVTYIKALYKEYPSQPNVKNRKFLQYIGTEFGRSVMGNNVWINVMKARATGKQLDIAIVDDVRFENEAKAMDYTILIDHTLAFEEWEQVCDNKGYDHKTLHSSEQDDLKPYATLIMKPYTNHFPIVETVLDFIYFQKGMHR